MMEKAEDAGFALEAIRATKNNFITIIDNQDNLDGLQPVVTSGYNEAKAIRIEIANNRKHYAYADTRALAQSAFAMCITSGSVAGTIIPGSESIVDCPSFLNNDHSQTVQTLVRLDPALADTYREVEEVYYATNADNTRAAMAQIRQFFDHFFDKLAPDDLVRASKYWRRKTKEKKEKDEEFITRRERITYSINSHVKNESRRNLLIRDLDNIIDSYKALNALHTRGRVNNQAAKNALFATKHFLEYFAESIETTSIE